MPDEFRTALSYAIHFARGLALLLVEKGIIAADELQRVSEAASVQAERESGASERPGS